MVIWHAIFRERCCHDDQLFYGAVPLIYRVLYTTQTPYVLRAYVFAWLLACSLAACALVWPGCYSVLFSVLHSLATATFHDLFWRFAEFPIRSRQTIESVSLCLSDISWRCVLDCCFFQSLCGSHRYFNTLSTTSATTFAATTILHTNWYHILLLVLRVSTF